MSSLQRKESLSHFSQPIRQQQCQMGCRKIASLSYYFQELEVVFWRNRARWGYNSRIIDPKSLVYLALLKRDINHTEKHSLCHSVPCTILSLCLSFCCSEGCLGFWNCTQSPSEWISKASPNLEFRQTTLYVSFHVRKAGYFPKVLYVIDAEEKQIPLIQILFTASPEGKAEFNKLK